MSIWRKIAWKEFGFSKKPKVPEPRVGLLHRLDDEDSLYVHEITQASYNLYTKGGLAWLTVRVSADEAELAPGEPRTNTWLELNLPVSALSESLTHEGAELKIPDYSAELGNLTNMYYYSHSHFENAVLLVEKRDVGGFAGRISGETQCDPVVVRAVFSLDPNLKRSFN